MVMMCTHAYIAVLHPCVNFVKKVLLFPIIYTRVLEDVKFRGAVNFYPHFLLFFQIICPSETDFCPIWGGGLQPPASHAYEYIYHIVQGIYSTGKLWKRLNITVRSKLNIKNINKRGSQYTPGCQN